ncbi:MAG: hypothetical protein JJU29_06885 [Verrucomicrobia bacterium]|nr:hypothetical protein [Verrucomicrobiota bacterium]MCH8512388.1 hypothetical protein [Kiritimatiellia bacterium]
MKNQHFHFPHKKKRQSGFRRNVVGVANLAFLMFATGFSIGNLHAESTINDEAKYGYAANGGWINFRPSVDDGVVTGGFFLSGHAWGANFGWINLGNGAPANGWSYANDSETDYGVNLTDFGNLAGYAWGANIGWINFNWANSIDPNRPRIDLLTGEFKGYAYAANLGWIHLGDGQLKTDSFLRVDSDGDGIEDAWEYRYFGNLNTADEESDFTEDGFTDLEHYQAGTDPTQLGAPLRILSFDLVKNGDDDAAGFEFTSSPLRVYRVESTAELQSPDEPADPWEAASETFAPEAGNVTNIQLDLQELPAMEFFRIRALQPLQE